MEWLKYTSFQLMYILCDDGMSKINSEYLSVYNYEKDLTKKTVTI